MTIDCCTDFFIYVPTVHDVENPSRVNQARGDDIASRPINPLILSLKEWVKIPLEGTLVVYARLREGQLALL
jgi:hypothetical protein